jgi:hypothetical protein
MLLQLIQEFQPGLLRHDPLEDTLRVGDQQLSRSKLDEKLLNQFQGGMDLYSHRSLYPSPNISTDSADQAALTRSIYREMSYGLYLSENDSAKLKILMTLLLVFGPSSGMRFS